MKTCVYAEGFGSISCLLSENLSKINPIYESFLSSGVNFGPLEVILVTGIRF